MSTVLDMLETVARRLEELIDDVVFVGGATTSLLVTDAAVIEIRPTIDIDLIVDITSLPKYAGLEKRLRRKGFTNVVELDAPICRWRVEGILVDVMPSLPDILGFSNR